MVILTQDLADASCHQADWHPAWWVRCEAQRWDRPHRDNFPRDLVRSTDAVCTSNLRPLPDTQKSECCNW